MSQPTKNRFELPRERSGLALLIGIIAAILAAIGFVLAFKWQKKHGSGFRGQRGISLIETVVTVAILAAIGVVFMRAMYTSYKSSGIVDEQQQAETLARSQLEAIKNSVYQDNGVYSIVVTPPPQYSVNITVTAPTQIGTLEDNTPLEVLVGGPVTTIQEITVTVFHGSKSVLSVAAYKVKP